MISTWGIFWIGLFGASVINTLVKSIFKVYPTQRLNRLTPEQKEKVREFIKDLTHDFAKTLGESINVTVEEHVREVKSKKSKKEDVQAN